MYHVLLILTDGKINDHEETRNLVVECSKYPLSIIIVGVGNSSDFGEMVYLDGDINPVRNSLGVLASRDIVQFVEFNKMGKGANIGLLAEHVLMEIPDQILGYMSANNTLPTPSFS